MCSCYGENRAKLSSKGSINSIQQYPSLRATGAVTDAIPHDDNHLNPIPIVATSSWPLHCLLKWLGDGGRIRHTAFYKREQTLENQTKRAGRTPHNLDPKASSYAGSRVRNGVPLSTHLGAGDVHGDFEFICVQIPGALGRVWKLEVGGFRRVLQHTAEFVNST